MTLKDLLKSKAITQGFRKIQCWEDESYPITYFEGYNFEPSEALEPYLDREISCTYPYIFGNSEACLCIELTPNKEINNVANPKAKKNNKKTMTYAEALRIARSVRRNLSNFNDVYDEEKLILYSFEYKGECLDVFATIRMEKDEDHKWFAIYSGVEFSGGDDLYSNYDHSTDTLQVIELAKKIQYLANYYKSEEHLKELEI